MSIVQKVNSSQPSVATGSLCLHELLAETSARAPDAVALDDGTRTITYRTWDEQANQLAWMLRNLGVGPNVVVGLAVHQGQNDLEMMVGLFAILKAGGAYVIFDQFYPDETVQRMILDAKVNLILVVQRIEAERLEPLLPSKYASIVCLEDGDVQQLVANQPTTSPPSGVTAQSLAYVIYTSGSTGLPKGVRCPHSPLDLLASHQVALYEVQASDRLSQLFPARWDGFLSPVVTAIKAGATLCFPPAEALRRGPHTVEWLERAQITLAHETPTCLAVWPKADLPNLAAIVSPGEPCPADLARWHVQHGRRFYLAYGPTEGMLCVSSYRYLGDSGTPTMGYLYPYVEAEIWDKDGWEAPPGEVGELILFRYLADGYTDEEQTRTRFFERDGRRAYHTGDLVRRAPDGALEFQGRSDEQIKLPGGILVNLSGIEQAIGEHPAVRACKVLVRQQRYLLTHVVLEQPGQLPMRELRDWLRDHLPATFLTRCYCIEESALPLLPNGKVNPDPAHYRLPTVEEIVAFDGEFRAPVTAMEFELATIVTTVAADLLLYPDPLLTNVLKTLPELLVESLLIGEVEEQIVERWNLELTEEQVSWPFWRIAELLAGGPTPFPALEGC